MELEMLHMFMWVIGGLLSLLVLIVGWIGSRIYKSLDELTDTVNDIDRNFRADLGNMKSRLAVVESKQASMGQTLLQLQRGGT